MLCSNPRETSGAVQEERVRRKSQSPERVKSGRRDISGDSGNGRLRTRCICEMEKLRGLIRENQKKSMEKQQSFRCVENNQPRMARALEKQVSFQGVNVENHQPSRLGRSMEKQQSFRGVTVENQKRGVMEKLPSFGKASMERQKSFRGGLLEKQKSFRVVMERQLSFIGERRKKNESPGKRGDSPLHIAARTGNLGKVKELIRGCCDGDGQELRDLLSKQNLEGETPLYIAAENGHSIVVEEMLKHMDLETASIAAKP